VREFITQDGTRIQLPDTQQRPDMVESPWEPCPCLQQMGNDFYFLPMGSCLFPDSPCDAR
jgi:hypothetical protein